jgi:aryl-alcohol dehydrogenase-like predicted oxidoreductase
MAAAHFAVLTAWLNLAWEVLAVLAAGLELPALWPPTDHPPTTRDDLTIRHAVELGVTFFDTTQMYGPSSTRSLSAKLYSQYARAS